MNEWERGCPLQDVVVLRDDIALPHPYSDTASAPSLPLPFSPSPLWRLLTKAGRQDNDKDRDERERRERREIGGPFLSLFPPLLFFIHIKQGTALRVLTTTSRTTHGHDSCPVCICIYM
jgi:hypothetical protein